MKSSDSNGTGGGVGVTGLLQVAFIVLKLCKIINWAWVWVLAPTWITILIAIVAIVLIIFRG